MPRKAFVFGFCFDGFTIPRKIHVLKWFYSNLPFLPTIPKPQSRNQTQVWFSLMQRKQKQFDRRNAVLLSKYAALRAAKKHKALVPLAKRAAKKDKHSCHKARAWRCKGTFAVSAKQVKLSKIDWI